MPLALFTPSFGFNQKLSTLLYGKNIGPNQVFIHPLFDEAKLDKQTSLFKMILMFIALTILKPPTNCNPCLKMSAILLANNRIVSHKLFEWLKFISMTIVLGSVEDEQCFFTLFFTKNKLRN
jgi:hypothetical protein